MSRRWPWTRRERSAVSGALGGALAGAGAGWLMSRVTTLLSERQDPAARHRETEALGGKLAYEVAAQKAARLMGRELVDERARTLGRRLHQALAVGGGAVYGAVRARRRRMGVGAGLLFGLGFFVLVDELANMALGFTPGPRAFPWQAHARGLAGHLTYGLATEAELRLLDRVLPSG
jgi:hypothetical protein